MPIRKRSCGGVIEKDGRLEMKMKIWIVTAFSAAFMASAAEGQPVISWDFDRMENGVAVSADGKYQAKVIRSEHVAAVPGKLGNAVRIGGKYKGNQAGGLSVKNFKFDFTKPFTVEILVRFEEKIERKQRREIFSMADTEHGPGIRFSLYYDCLELSTGDGKKVNQLRTASSVLQVSPDQWHLLTIAGDGKKITIYYDGVPAAEKEMAVIPVRKTKFLSVGSYKNGLAYPLNGAVDELRFYDFCKTSAQVADQYVAIFGE